MNIRMKEAHLREAKYHTRGYWRSEDLWTSFAVRAAAHPAGVALIAEDRQITFGELSDRAARLGAGLRQHGVQPGDVVVVHGRNSIEATMALLACAYAGAVMTPVPPMFSVAQLAGVFESARARAVLALSDDKTGPCGCRR